MKNQLAILLIACTLFFVSCEDKFADLEENNIETSLKSATSEYDLVYRWAPVHYQDTDVTGSHGLSGKGDYVTAINYDGDWNALNNWDNLPNKSAKAHCYYSVVETSTHWFIIYAFFHPRDWTDNWFLYHWDEHENDLEGCLSIIKKDGSTYGQFQGMITVFHNDFYSFTPNGSPLQGNKEDIDGTVSYKDYDGKRHPKTAQECRGHGLKAHPYCKINGGDGVIYYPSYNGTAEEPSNANDRNVKYKLVDIFQSGGLWDQRTNTNLFQDNQKVFKRNNGNGHANAPWNWDDHNDGGSYAGEFANDPVKLVKHYFKNLGNCSNTYTKNKYVGIN